MVLRTGWGEERQLAGSLVWGCCLRAGQLRPVVLPLRSRCPSVARTLSLFHCHDTVTRVRCHRPWVSLSIHLTRFPRLFHTHRHDALRWSPCEQLQTTQFELLPALVLNPVETSSVGVGPAELRLLRR